MVSHQVRIVVMSQDCSMQILPATCYVKSCNSSCYPLARICFRSCHVCISCIHVYVDIYIYIFIYICIIDRYTLREKDRAIYIHMCIHICLVFICFHSRSYTSAIKLSCFKAFTSDPHFCSSCLIFWPAWNAQAAESLNWMLNVLNILTVTINYLLDFNKATNYILNTSE